MKSFTRNSITSIFTTALDFGVLTGMVELLHVHYVLAVFCGTVVGATSNFIINRRWSFEATHSVPHWQLVRFLPVQVGSSGLQTLGVWLLTEHSRLSYFGSKIVISIAVYLCWNYPMNRWFVFRRWKTSPGGPAGTSTRAA